MAKTCKAENCYNPVWGKGYCSRHQSLRTDKKPKKIPVRTKRERIAEFNFGFESQVDLFAQLWDNAKNEKGEVFCKFTGEKLNSWAAQESWYYSLFAHVLNKKNYPWFRLNPENIRIVLPEFHTLVDNGTADQKAKHPTWRFDLWYNEVEKMKQEYIAFKKKNLLA